MQQVNTPIVDVIRIESKLGQNSMLFFRGARPPPRKRDRTVPKPLSIFSPSCVSKDFKIGHSWHTSVGSSPKMPTTRSHTRSTNSSRPDNTAKEMSDSLWASSASTACFTFFPVSSVWVVPPDSRVSSGRLNVPVSSDLAKRLNFPS